MKTDIIREPMIRFTILNTQLYIINGKIRILIFLIDIDAKFVLFPYNSCKSIHYYLNSENQQRLGSFCTKSVFSIS